MHTIIYQNQSGQKFQLQCPKHLVSKQETNLESQGLTIINKSKLWKV